MMRFDAALGFRLAATALLACTLVGCGLDDGSPNHSSESADRSGASEPNASSTEVASADDGPNLSEVPRPRVDVDRSVPGHPESSRTATDGEDDGDVRPFSDEWLERRDEAIAPWTYVLDAETVESATVTDSALRFPPDAGDAVAGLQKFDIVVGRSTEQPFLRRVLSVQKTDDGYLVETERANLEAAILKGQIRSGGADSGSTDPGSGPPRPAPSDGEYRTKTQQLRNGPVDYTSLGSYDANALGLGGSTDLVPPFGVYTGAGATFDIDVQGTPTARIHPKYWFDLEIDFDTGDASPSKNHFFSTRRCQTDIDCFDGGLAGGEECMAYDPGTWPDLDPAIADKLVPYNPSKRQTARYCVYDARPDGEQVKVRQEDGGYEEHDEYRTCEDLLDTLEWIKDDSDGQTCGNDWKTWYDSGGKKGARLPDSCDTWTRNAFAPYPAQLEWAKLVCSGTLRRLEVDLRADAKVGVEDFQMNASGTGFKAWTPIDFGSKTLSTPTYWVGWVPVVMTFNFSLSMPVVLSLSGNLRLNEESPEFVGVDEVSLQGGGLHLYGDRKAYENGHFGPKDASSSYFRDLHVNDVSAPSPTYHSPSVGGGVTGGVYVGLMPEVSLLLYDMAGPFVRPIVPYFTAFAGEGTDKKCNLGFKAGIKGSAGAKAQLPFGVGDAKSSSSSPSGTRGKIYDLLGWNPFVKWSLYDTCGSGQSFIEGAFYEDKSVESDPDLMCRDGAEQLCYRKCLVGDCEAEPEADAGGMSDASSSVDAGSGSGGGGSETDDSDDSNESGGPSPSRSETGGTDAGCTSLPATPPPLGLLLVAAAALGLRRW